MSALRHLLWVWKRWSCWCWIPSNTYWSRLYEASDKGIFFWRDANPADLELQKRAAAHRPLERSENCWIILPTRNCFCQRTAIGQCNLYLDILFVSLRNALRILLKWIRQMRHTLCMTSCIPAQMITFNQYQTLCLLELQMNRRMSFAAFCNWIRSNCICKKPRKFNLES